MSWINEITAELTITTGDGVEYKPQYLVARKIVEYNVAEFNYPNVPGSKVDRNMPKGTRHRFVFFFQGENHLAEMKAFEKSANDRRPWTISHPFYGRLTVHPLSIEYDPTKINTTKVTGDFIETITQITPTSTVDAKQRIINKVVQLSETTVADISRRLVVSQPDINQMSANVSDLSTLAEDIEKTQDETNGYKDQLAKANGAILNAFANIGNAVAQMNAFINYPFQFTASVGSRINLLRNQFLKLAETVTNLTSGNSKEIYLANSTGLTGALCRTSVSPTEGDYPNADEVLGVLGIVLDTYSELIDNLDSLQTGTGGEQDGFVPNFNTLLDLDNLVNLTASELMQVALNAIQKRTLILEQDSNAIILAHRFYGPSSDDSNLERFMDQNNIGISEMLAIKKGREIVYYV